MNDFPKKMFIENRKPETTQWVSSYSTSRMTCQSPHKASAH